MNSKNIVENGVSLLITVCCFITLTFISLISAFLFQTKFLAFVFIVILLITFFYIWIFGLYLKQKHRKGE